MGVGKCLFNSEFVDLRVPEFACLHTVPAHYTSMYENWWLAQYRILLLWQKTKESSYCWHKVLAITCVL